MKDKPHNYDYDVDTTSETAPANVIRMVGQNKRVLEIGCGPGSTTKILVQQGLCQVTGVELDPEAIKKVTPYCERVIQADLNSSEWSDLLDGIEKFDVVVVADVLEHLYDPWTALQRMMRFINADGYIVISLPHVGHAAVMSCLINGDFSYRNWGLLDRTHIRFFGLQNIEDLFAQANLKIIEARYVTKLPEETEFAESWSKLSPFVQDTLMASKDSEVYQVVVKVVPLDYGTDAPVSLVAPEHKYQRPVVVIEKLLEPDRLRHQIVERNDEINKLNQEMNRLNESFLVLYASTSWRISKPIRLLKNIITGSRDN